MGKTLPASRLYSLGGVINCFEKIWQSLDGVLGLSVMMSRVVAGGNPVHVLPIELESVESPVHQNLFHQRFVIFHHAAIGRTQIIGIPPRDFSRGTDRGSATRSQDDRAALASSGTALNGDHQS